MPCVQLDGGAWSTHAGSHTAGSLAPAPPSRSCSSAAVNGALSSSASDAVGSASARAAAASRSRQLTCTCPRGRTTAAPSAAGRSAVAAAPAAAAGAVALERSASCRPPKSSKSVSGLSSSWRSLRRLVSCGATVRTTWATMSTFSMSFVGCHSGDGGGDGGGGDGGGAQTSCIQLAVTMVRRSLASREMRRSPPLLSIRATSAYEQRKHRGPG